MVDLSLTSIFPANQEQKLESRRRTFPEWGKGATLEQYMERDAQIDAKEVAQDNRFTTWVLALRDSHDDLNFFCTCETFHRDGFVYKPGRRPELVTCYGIASVFTPPENRKKGYAKHMMRLLHWVLARDTALPSTFPVEWGAPPERVAFAGDAAFSALYSDVGEEFYAACGMLPREIGWVARDSFSTIWKVRQVADIPMLNGLHPDGPRWEWLDENGVSRLWNEDRKLMKLELTDPSPESVSQIKVTFLPDKGVAEYQHDRLRYLWEKLKPVPKYFGVSGSSGDSPTLFATWTLDVRPPNSNNLIITRLRAGREDFLALLKQFVDYAMQHRVEEIEFWNLPPHLQELADATGATTFVRDEHVPLIKWYGEVGDDDKENVSWVFNEKFVIFSI